MQNDTLKKIREKIVIVSKMRVKEIADISECNAMTYKQFARHAYTKYGTAEKVLLNDSALGLLVEKACKKIAQRDGIVGKKLIKDVGISIDEITVWGDSFLEEGVGLEAPAQEVIATVLMAIDDNYVCTWHCIDWLKENVDSVEAYFEISWLGWLKAPRAVKKLGVKYKSKKVDINGARKQEKLIFSNGSEELKGILDWIEVRGKQGLSSKVFMPGLKKRVGEIEAEMHARLFFGNVWSGKGVERLPIKFGVSRNIQASVSGWLVVAFIDAFKDGASDKDWERILCCRVLGGADKKIKHRRNVAEKIKRNESKVVLASLVKHLANAEGDLYLVDLLSRLETLREEKYTSKEFGIWLNSFLGCFFNKNANVSLVEASALESIRMAVKSLYELAPVTSAHTGRYWLDLYVRELNSLVLKEGNKNNVACFFDADDCFVEPGDDTWCAGLDLNMWGGEWKKPALIDEMVLAEWGHPCVQEKQWKEDRVKWLETVVNTSFCGVISCARKYENSLAVPVFEGIEVDKDEAQPWFSKAIDCEFGVNEITPVKFEQQSGVLARGQEWIGKHNECAMLAFLEIRLGINREGKKYLGISPRRLSLIAHKAMELAWREIKTKQTLLKMMPTIGKDISRWSLKGFDHVAEKEWLDINQKDQIVRVVSNLVAISLKSDVERQEDFEMLGQEVRINIDVLQYRIKGIIDLLYLVKTEEEQGQILRDFKRYGFSVSNWGSELSDLQLPLYAISEDVDAKGIEIEQLLAKEHKVLGFGEIKNVKGMRERLNGEGFDRFKQRTKLVVETIVSEISDGVCERSPKKKTACKDCHLLAVCHGV